MDSWRLQRRWRRLQRPLAFVLIAVGGFLVWARGNAPPVTVPTVVATADIPAGRVVAAQDVTVVGWPADTHPPPAVSDPGALVGRRATAQIRAGEPLTPQRVVGPSLLSQSSPGAVAVALPPDPLSASGLVRPGDRVDVVGSTDGDARTLTSGAAVLTVDAESGAVVAVPASTAAAVVRAAATDSIALVLTGA